MGQTETETPRATDGNASGDYSNAYSFGAGALVMAGIGAVGMAFNTRGNKTALAARNPQQQRGAPLNGRRIGSFNSFNKSVNNRGSVEPDAQPRTISAWLPGSLVSAPSHLDGTYAGDEGFDPLGFSNADNIKFYREAEMKHGRLAMLAAAGWPLSEIWQKEFASI